MSESDPKPESSEPSVFDKFKAAIEFWHPGALLTAQRELLLDKAKRQEERARGKSPSPRPPQPVPPPDARDHPIKVPKPPETLYEVVTVYRYTRGNNDLTNPGMGYGELTPEQCWELRKGALVEITFNVRRTRSGRQRIDPENKRGNSVVPAPPSSAPTSGKV